MSALSNTERLHQAIADLEIKRQEQGELVSEQFQYIREQLQPANLVKMVVSDIFASPDIRTGVVDYAIGVTSGMIAKKMVTGQSPNIFNQLLGNAVQMIVTREVSQHPEAIKNLGKNLLQRLL
ncbi:MAG: hypothetical protein V4604_07010 [Bacteroidota bacterium]